MIAWLAGLALAQDCDVEPKLGRAAESVAMAQLSSAEIALDEARDEMQCSGVLSSDQVSRYFQIQAVLALRQVADPALDVQQKAEKLAYADDAFALAHALAPNSWIADFGQRTEYEQFVNAPAPSGKPAHLILVNKDAGEWVAVDGQEVDAPYTLTPGLHVLQVGGKDGAGRFARELAAPDGGVTMDLVLPPPGAPSTAWRDAALTVSTPLTPAQKRKQRMTVAIASGIAGAALYGGAVVTRSVYNIDSDDNGLPDNPSNTLNTAANGMYLGSVAAGATGGVFLTLALTTPVTH